MTNIIRDQNGNIVSYQSLSGHWYVKEFDAQGRQIFYKESTGYWQKRSYDQNGNMTVTAARR
jgi:hypothetical protein